MPLNQTAYTVNPAKSVTLGVLQTVTANATTTIYTVGAGEAKKVTSFTITNVLTGTSGTDYVSVTLTIGGAKFYLTFDSAAVPGVKTTITSESLGFAPSFLQVGDVISITNAKTGAPGGNNAVSITLDEYEQ